MSPTPPNSRPLAAIVLAAGKGTRMRSDLPKVLHPVAGRPMVGHAIAAAEALGAARIVVVVGPDMGAVAEFVAPHPVAVQTDRRGTADAVKAARRELADFAGDILIIYGDCPLIRAETLAGMWRNRTDEAVTVLGMRVPEQNPYGRLVMNADGELERIVEALDASEDERGIDLCNSGVMIVAGEHLFGLLNKIGDDNAQGEFYLTDIIGVAREAGLICRVVEGPFEETQGVNSRTELAAAEKLMQGRLRAAAMENGATLTDPATVWFSWDTRLGRDVTIGPNVVFGPGVTVADRVEIRAFCHIEQAEIGAGAIVGPFARLRPGARLGESTHIGNFVEIKNARIDAGAKVNHLTYIGDAEIGAGANVGAGTITCNYDGVRKMKTVIGAGAFIGSDTTLVAPVTVGAGAYVGAGSTITKDVPGDALAVSRAQQTVRPGWAAAFRAKTGKQKE